MVVTIVAQSTTKTFSEILFYNDYLLLYSCNYQFRQDFLTTKVCDHKVSISCYKLKRNTDSTFEAEFCFTRDLDLDEMKFFYSSLISVFNGKLLIWLSQSEEVIVI